MPWDQTNTFIRSGHRTPEDFDPETLKMITLNEEEGIQAITGKPWSQQSTEVVTYLFSKEKNWTTEKAQEWFNSHEKKAKESFSWTGTIKNIPQTGNLIRGKALHPIRTVHPQEWPQIREYLKEELEKSAHTLAGTPLILDHNKPLEGRVLGAQYEDGAIEYVAQLDDSTIIEQIADGTIRHCSVEFEWKTLEKLNGHAPRGIKFTGLSLLKDYQPGDPQTTVELWEAIINTLKEPETKEQTSETPLPDLPEPEAPKPLGEAILCVSEPVDSDFIPKTEVLGLLPDDWIVSSWSLGPQLLVRQLKHKLGSQSTTMTGSNQG